MVSFVFVSAQVKSISCIRNSDTFEIKEKNVTYIGISYLGKTDAGWEFPFYSFKTNNFSYTCA